MAHRLLPYAASLNPVVTNPEVTNPFRTILAAKEKSETM
jgi:hypothetical protein